MLLKQKKYGFPDMVTMSFMASPFYSIIFATKYIADALIPVFSIFITANFINSAIAVYNKQTCISSVYVPVVLLTAILIYNTTIGTIMNFIECKRNIYFRKKLTPEILEKQAKLEYRHIENPETADLIVRVCPKFPDNVWDMYWQVLNAANLVIYIMGVLIALFTQVWWVALGMFISFIPILYIATKAGGRSYDADRELSKTTRRMNYLSDVMKSREAAEERSLYGYTGNLNNQYAEKFNFAYKFRLKVQAKNFIKWKMGGLVSSIYSIIIMFAMLIPVSNGDIDLGMFIGLMSGVFGLITSNSVSWGIYGTIENLAKKREYLKDLSKFIRLEEHDGAIDLPVQNMSFNKIEFRNVSFKYPGTDKLILDDISFTIENGKHYSLVGINGAGKTTVTKLLTGLYTNYEGEILADGRSLRDFTQSEIKGLSSVVYQDFAKYYISLYDNIAIAGYDVENAIELVGLSGAVEKLKDGVNTPLGKIQASGADLSGGEWQRVAMARSVVNCAPLKILDEPTAALDPVSESAVYKNFERISKGQTTIFISHRLGSTKLADIIYVLSDGKIIESGSHSELMTVKNGVYAEMFNSQAEWYKSRTSSCEEAIANV
ncbi:MAG: ABC transporter ATP-binding protein/permease [Oscillospiraceae bacterium]|nr:ABC transporter ATP-binding protein/permease [Oscillospiraceae bacterium]